MAFVRAKRVGTGTYYYLVDSVRTDDGKVRQRNLAFLGTHGTVDAAYRYWLKESRKRLSPASAKAAGFGEAMTDQMTRFRWHEHVLHAKNMAKFLSQYREKKGR